MASELEPCPFCSKTMMLRSALWPSEGDADAIIHADPTDCPMLGFSDGSADGSIIEKWNCSLSNEDDFPSDGSCVRCGSVPRNANGLCNTCLDEDAERLENTRTTPVAPVSPDTDGKEPAATDTGLETVMRRYRGTDWPDHYPWAFLNESECQGEPGPRWTIEKLCLQSQAAELLAAKDKTIALAETTMIEMHQDLNKLEAELAAERAEKEIAERNRDAARENFLTMQKSAAKLLKRAEKAEADNAAKDEEIERCEFLLREKDIQHRSVLEQLSNDNAAKDARIKELEEAVRDDIAFGKAFEAKLAAAEKSAFEHGYVMACCNIVNLHDEPTIAHCTLSELGVTRAAVKAMNLSEYDLKALRKIERDRSRSPYAKTKRKARAVLGGKPS